MTTWSLIIGLTPLLVMFLVVVPVVWRRQRKRPPNVAVLESREPRSAVRDRTRHR